MELIRDIRAGMSECDLMEKYRLTAVELTRLLDRLNDMREGLARNLAYDIRKGKSDTELMIKYGISELGLQNAFIKLLQENLVDRSLLAGRIPEFGRSLEVEDMRSSVRLVPTIPIKVMDDEEPNRKGSLLDIHERGVGVVDIVSRPGQIKRLVVLPNEYGEFGAFVMDAQCRWSLTHSDGLCRAGFEIIRITPGNLREYRFLLRAHTRSG